MDQLAGEWMKPHCEEAGEGKSKEGREKRKESVFGLLLNGPSVALKTQISAHRQLRNRVGEGRVRGIAKRTSLVRAYFRLEPIG
jgi:hypothetical protein